MVRVKRQRFEQSKEGHQSLDHPVDDDPLEHHPSGITFLQCVSSSSATQSPFVLSPHNRHFHDDDWKISNHDHDDYHHHPKQQQYTKPNQDSSRHKCAMLGITSCLPFDPETGNQPYGNMRILDSPPSLTLVSLWPHSRDNSWGRSGVSDHNRSSSK